MIRSSSQRVAAWTIATAVLLLGAAPVAAAAPTVDSWTDHVERPFLECPGFSVLGVWDISHDLKLFFDSEGTAIRDIEQVAFTGALVNTSTGASVPDGGARIFFDTLAPNGSYLTTYMVNVRHSAYIHGAGRVDFQTGDLDGLDGMDPASVAALCTALGA